MAKNNYKDCVTVDTEIKNSEEESSNIVNYCFFGISEKWTQTDLTMRDIEELDSLNKAKNDIKIFNQKLINKLEYSANPELFQDVQKSKNNESLDNSAQNTKIKNIENQNENQSNSNSNKVKSFNKKKKENLINKKRKRENEEKSSSNTNKKNLKLKIKDKNNKNNLSKNKDKNNEPKNKEKIKKEKDDIKNKLNDNNKTDKNEKTNDKTNNNSNNKEESKLIKNKKEKNKNDNTNKNENTNKNNNNKTNENDNKENKDDISDIKNMISNIIDESVLKSSSRAIYPKVNAYMLFKKEYKQMHDNIKDSELETKCQEDWSKMSKELKKYYNMNAENENKIIKQSINKLKMSKKKNISENNSDNDDKKDNVNTK